ILDKSQISQKYSSSTFFTNQGFDLRIDVKHAIYHDKVMIIDDKTVITGSFNFTKAAETKNAENLLVLRNNPELAKLYAQDWWYNWKLAVPRNEFTPKTRSRDTTDD
ncbi:MAG: phospholipase D family protein, partial [Neisseriaceae bacterium]